MKPLVVALIFLTLSGIGFYFLKKNPTSHLARELRIESPEEQIKQWKNEYFQDPQYFNVFQKYKNESAWSSIFLGESWPSWVFQEKHLLHFLLKAALVNEQLPHRLKIQEVFQKGELDEKILAFQWGLRQKEWHSELFEWGLLKESSVPIRLFVAAEVPAFPQYPALLDIYQKEADWRVRSLLLVSTLEEIQKDRLERWLTEFPGIFTEDLAHRYLGLKERVSVEVLLQKLKEPFVISSSPLFQKRFQRESEEVDVTNFLKNAYRYLARHQKDDGSFDCSQQNPFHNEVSLPGFSYEDDQVDLAVTALGLLTFFAGGNTPSRGLYAKQVEKATQFLLASQKDGRFETLDLPHHTFDVYVPYKNSRVKTRVVGKGGRTLDLVHRYNHSLSTLALLEWYGMTLDPSLIKPIDRALQEFGRLQGNRLREVISSPTFSYYIELGDVATTVFMLESIVLAKRLGFSVDPKHEVALREYVEKTNLGKKSSHASELVRAYCFGGQSSVAVALVMEKLLELERPPIEEAGRQYILKHLPAWQFYQDLPETEAETQKNHGNIVDFHYWYYGARALYLTGENRVFLNHLKQILPEGVLQYGDEYGSMKPEGIWCRVGGRLYATMMTVLAFQVPYSETFKK